MSPTGTPPDKTPHLTAQLVQLPSVVAAGTSILLGPTPDATQLARDNLDHYIINKLYEEPATPVAQGTNTTPIPNEVFTGLTLTTYEVQEVTFPQQVTWDAWVPDAQYGLALRSITFDTAWRVTVKGHGFIIGNNFWEMWADDILLGRCAEANGGLTTIVYDRSLLTEGAKLGVSFGGGLTYLPEGLHLPPGP